VYSLEVAFLFLPSEELLMLEGPNTTWYSEGAFDKYGVVLIDFLFVRRFLFAVGVRIRETLSKVMLSVSPVDAGYS